MYNLYKNDAEATITKHNLSRYEIETLYHYQQMEYKTQDAKMHIEDMYQKGEISEMMKNELIDCAQDIAEKYIYVYHDCDLPENDIFEEIIRNYLKY